MQFRLLSSVLFERLFALGASSHYCCMVGSIVHSVVNNQMGHLDLCTFRFLEVGNCFASDFSVHGRRAVRQSARNSRTWKNRKGGRLEDAVIWHEGQHTIAQCLLTVTVIFKINRHKKMTGCFLLNRLLAMIQSLLQRCQPAGGWNRCLWSSSGPSVTTSLSTLPCCLLLLVS